MGCAIWTHSNDFGTPFKGGDVTLRSQMDEMKVKVWYVVWGTTLSAKYLSHSKWQRIRTMGVKEVLQSEESCVA